MPKVSASRIICEDGFSMSIVVSQFGLEIGYPSALDPILEKMDASGCNMDERTSDGLVDACWESGVTVRIIISIIDSHGGRHIDQEGGSMSRLLRHWGTCDQVVW